MSARVLLPALCGALLAGCAAKQENQQVEIAAAGTTEAPPRWRLAITPRDQERLQTLRYEWAGLHDKLAPRVRNAQGKVADPGAGLDHPEFTPGSYRCRIVRLRAATRGGATARSTAPGFCYISSADDGFAFVKQTGIEPTAGYLYPDGNRYIFLGARQAKAGDNSLGYSEDPDRDVVGVAERVGAFRWRLALAGPTPDALDVYELTPVAADQQPEG